ncbi:MAG: M23 family peptidase [Bacteroidetes bacterium]|nr:MAG: M23 family peptidase [Bacteroidota bacterium]
MRKEKFIYNTQTLRYEKVVEPLSTTLTRIFGIVCAILFTAGFLALFSLKYLPSPTEKALLAEIDVLKNELEASNSSYDELTAIMSEIKERHNYAHRLIYGMDPIDDGVWEGGVGGHDKYKNLREFKNSGALMAEVNSKIDHVKQKLDIYSKSVSDVVELAKEKEEMLACIPSIKPVRSDKLARSVRLLSGFGYRIHPIYKVRKMHAGIDFTAPTGTPIQATGNGTVIKAGRGTGYGKRVIIDHGYGYQTLYAHMHKIDVKVGQKVTRGEQIGQVGSTGASTAPHCHYEVIHNDRKVNPIQFVMDGLSPEEYQELVNAASLENQSMD